MEQELNEYFLRLLVGLEGVLKVVVPIIIIVLIVKRKEVKKWWKRS